MEEVWIPGSYSRSRHESQGSMSEAGKTKGYSTNKERQNQQTHTGYRELTRLPGQKTHQTEIQLVMIQQGSNERPKYRSALENLGTPERIYRSTNKRAGQRNSTMKRTKL
ncbi:hypothetical protein EYF80_028145 [Liparis tanakae]|uniref:Uncharacterized protein n=1 Tax=Liparis tanakae TaxID=230148 RepID=A0A4Z2H801_9TELE|nr:hypothetical protein EYF80_028145 [Liparis tanakae]